MSNLPILKTTRLILRPFLLSDANRVQELAGDKEIASTTLTVPHPYEDGIAEQWIGMLETECANGKGVAFAITNKDDGLIGCISLGINNSHRRAELGYWIGRKYWNKGYWTEASIALIQYGFEKIKLNKIHAHHFTRNPASGRVMSKSGMKYEGTLRQQVIKDGIYEDLAVYSILREDYK